MAQRRNLFTRMGRPPNREPLTRPKTSTGERQGVAPSDMFDPALPARAFRRGGQVMDRYHDDPNFHKKDGC